MVRTKKSYDAYYWLVISVILIALAVCVFVLLFRGSYCARSKAFAAFVLGVMFLAGSSISIGTTARLFCEYQFEPFGITEYSIFRRKRAIAWNDYPYAYIIRTGPMFRLPHSCTHYFLFAKKRLPSRIEKEKSKDPSHYYRNPKEYIIFGYSEDLEQELREMRPEITFIKRDLYR